MKEKDGHYQSPTYGEMDPGEVGKRIYTFTRENPKDDYTFIVGSDSQPKNGQGADFVTAVVVHRVGHGAIYFWKRHVEINKIIFQNRIYKEATLAIECAYEMLDILKDCKVTKYNLQIHVDVGENGKTKSLIKEVVGMIRGSGFQVKTKPDSYGASKVADRHT